MTQLLFRLAAPILLLALTEGAALAQSTSGSTGTAGDAATSETSVSAAGGAPALKAATTRDLITDVTPDAAALVTVSKSSDGKITTTPASAALLAALKGMAAPAPSGQVANAEAKAAKLAPVKSTAAYPFRAIGQVEVTYGSNSYFCTGVLIGPSTVATAAACLWGAENNPVWADKATFYPGMLGDKAPFGGSDWTNGLILQGFLDASTTMTSYGTLPYGIGLITLADPMGDKLGYFGYQTDINKSYVGNVITYGSGQTLHNLYTTTCPVDASTMYRSFAYPAPCPASGFGSPFYFDDGNGKAKILNGMNIWAFDDGSSGETRISPVIYEWISENRK